MVGSRVGEGPLGGHLSTSLHSQLYSVFHGEAGRVWAVSTPRWILSVDSTLSLASLCASAALG